MAARAAVRVAAAIREVSGTRPAGPGELARRTDLCAGEAAGSFVAELVLPSQHCPELQTSSRTRLPQ